MIPDRGAHDVVSISGCGGWGIPTTLVVVVVVAVFYR